MRLPLNSQIKGPWITTSQLSFTVLLIYENFTLRSFDCIRGVSFNETLEHEVVQVGAVDLVMNHIGIKDYAMQISP